MFFANQFKCFHVNFEFLMLCAVDSISKTTFICVDDSFCSEYGNKGGSSHIKSHS